MSSSLRRLCFVLPIDVDNAIPPASSDSEGTTRRHGRVMSILEAYARATAGCLLSCGASSATSRAAAAEGPVHNSSGMAMFEDITGMVDEDVAGRKQLAGTRGRPRIFSFSKSSTLGHAGSVSDGEVHSSSRFGHVYRTVLPSNGTTVAVKCVAGAHGGRFDKSFLGELAVVARLRRLRGWCVRAGEELMLVYDYMPNRSLDRLLFVPPPKAKAPTLAPALSWDRCCRIVTGLAAALFYLRNALFEMYGVLT